MRETTVARTRRFKGSGAIAASPCGHTGHSRRGIYSTVLGIAILRCLMAANTFSAVIGSDMTRAPIASSIAFAMAAAVGMIAVSPMLILLYGPLPVSDWKIAVFRCGISLILGIL